MAGMVVCSSWLEWEKKLGTEKLVDREMQLVRHTHTRAQGYFASRCHGFLFFLLGLSVPEKFWFYMHGYDSQRLSLRLTRRKECAQVISSSSLHLRRGSAEDHQNVANPKFHYSLHLM